MFISKKFPKLMVCLVALCLGTIIAAPNAYALIYSVFGISMDQLWADYYNRDDSPENLAQRADIMWQATQDLNETDKLREQTHLLFYKGMVEHDYKREKAADKLFAEAEKTWREWLKIDPSGRNRLVGVEIRTFRLLTKGFAYAITNALSLDSDLMKSVKEAPNELRVRIVHAMKYHYAPGILGGSIKKAIEMLLAVPDPEDAPTLYLKYYELAECYRELKRYDEARQALAVCFSLYPRSHHAQEILDKLK